MGNVRNPLAKNIDGSVGVGASYTKSSAITRLNFNSQLNYTATKWYVEQSSNAIYTITQTNRKRAYADRRHGRAYPLLVEIPLLVRLTLFRLVVPDLAISSIANGYKSLAQAGRYRLDYTLTITYEIVSNFFINQQFFFNYDRQPPTLDASQTDFGVVFSVSYRF